MALIIFAILKVGYPLPFCVVTASEINISIIRENMLNREIMGRLAEIYDCLTPENKKKVRVNAILQQRDALTNISNIPRRKTLDDF